MSGGDDGEEPQNHERWIVSYADFITLLFATFAALYAISFAIDKQKAAAFEMGVRDALDAPLAEKVTFVPPSDRRIPTLRQTADQSAGGALKEGAETAGEASEGESPRAPKWFGRLNEEFDRAGRDPKLHGRVEVQRTAQGEVIVRLRDSGTFAAGEATLSPAAQSLIDELAERLRTFDRIEVHVEGHTDDQSPGPRYPSNWELSAARATAVVQALLATGAVAPERISAAGFGSFRPIAENTSANNRAANRRIDLVIRPYRAPKPPAQEVAPPPDVGAATHWDRANEEPSTTQLQRAFGAPLGVSSPPSSATPATTPPPALTPTPSRAPRPPSE